MLCKLCCCHHSCEWELINACCSLQTEVILYVLINSCIWVCCMCAAACCVQKAVNVTFFFSNLQIAQMLQGEYDPRKKGGLKHIVERSLEVSRVNYLNMANMYMQP